MIDFTELGLNKKTQENWPHVQSINTDPVHLRVSNETPGYALPWSSSSCSNLDELHISDRWLPSNSSAAAAAAAMASLTTLRSYQSTKLDSSAELFINALLISRPNIGCGSAVCITSVCMET